MGLSLTSFVTPWRGLAHRHIPDGSPYDVLDTRFAGRAHNNRWNRASDPAVLVAEFARHLLDDADLAASRSAQARRVYDLSLELDRVIDVRDTSVSAALALTNAPACWVLVVFLENLDGGLAGVVQSIERNGLLRFDP